MPEAAKPGIPDALLSPSFRKGTISESRRLQQIDDALVFSLSTTISTERPLHKLLLACLKNVREARVELEQTHYQIDAPLIWEKSGSAPS